jgi:AcrR family transcriptional regulator
MIRFYVKRKTEPMTQEADRPENDGVNVRRRPQQQRSKLRVDAILDATMTLIGENGVDAVTMRDISRRIDAPISAIYQYFPNKSAIIAKLFHDFTATVKQDSAGSFAEIGNMDDAVAAFSKILDRYYERVRRDPAIQDVINAVLADKKLQHLDIEDSHWHAQAFADATAHLVSGRDQEQFQRATFLIAHLVGGLVRLALAVGDDEAKRVLEDYKLLARSYLAHFLR